MAFDKATIEKLKALKLDPDKLAAAAISEKEETVEIPEVQVFTTEELAARDQQTAKEGEKAAEKGVRTILIQEVGKRLGFEPKGERIGDLVADLQAKINASGDEKLKALQDQVTLLTTDKEKFAADLEKERATVSQVKMDYDIISDMPGKRLSVLNEKEYLNALKGIVEFKEDGVYRNGELMRDDKTKAALPRKTALETIFTERNWIDAGIQPPAGGRGGANSGAGASTGAPKNLSQAKEAWKAQNPEKHTNTLSPEFHNYVNTIAKADPQFSMEE